MRDCAPRSPTYATVGAWITGTLGAAVLLMLPALLARLSEERFFTAAQLGVFSFADLGGLTLGSALSAYLLPRNGLRRTMRYGIVLAALANFACAPVFNYGTLLILRLVAGLGAGLMVASAYVVLGRSQQADRSFAIFLLCQGAFSAVCLKSVPALTALVGVSGIFVLLGILYAAALATTPILPATSDDPHRRLPPARMHASSYAALVGILVFFIGQGGVWAYLELIGTQRGLDAATVSSGLALSTLLGLSGPTSAALLGQRLGRMVPLCVALTVAWIALYLLGTGVSGARFTLGACLFNIAWNFSIPYQLAILSQNDSNQAALAWAAATSLAGLAIGPMVASVVFHPYGAHGVLWLCGALYAASVIALGPALPGTSCLSCGA